MLYTHEIEFFIINKKKIFNELGEMKNHLENGQGRLDSREIENGLKLCQINLNKTTKIYSGVNILMQQTELLCVTALSLLRQVYYNLHVILGFSIINLNTHTSWSVRNIFRWICACINENMNKLFFFTQFSYQRFLNVHKLSMLLLTNVGVWLMILSGSNRRRKKIIWIKFHIFLVFSLERSFELKLLISSTLLKM